MSGEEPTRHLGSHECFYSLESLSYSAREFPSKLNGEPLRGISSLTRRNMGGGTDEERILQISRDLGYGGLSLESSESAQPALCEATVARDPYRRVSRSICCWLVPFDYWSRAVRPCATCHTGLLSRRTKYCKVLGREFLLYGTLKKGSKNGQSHDFSRDATDRVCRS
jgi:hypothetical protein